MGWRLRLSDKTVRKLAELPIYCRRQKCSPGNVVSGNIRFMQIFAGDRWRGGIKWEWGRTKWRFSVHSVTVFRTFYINGHTTAFRWYDCQWPWAYFKVIGLLHIKFLKNGVWYGKSYYRQLIGNHTLAFDWCHFLMTSKYIWRSLQPKLSFPRPFQLSLACFRIARSPSNSWASCYSPDDLLLPDRRHQNWHEIHKLPILTWCTKICKHEHKINSKKSHQINGTRWYVQKIN